MNNQGNDKKGTEGSGQEQQGQGITQEQAQANTRELLQRKDEAARQAEDSGQPGSQAGRYQSEQARAQAQELHQGEMRAQGTHGSISTQDRHNQGRRDSR